MTAEQGMRIGKVAELTGLTTQAIRYYEREGLLHQPLRTHTSYRIYGPEILGRLSFIKKARHLGFALEEIKQIMRMSEAGRAPCCKVRELLTEQLRQVDLNIRELSQFRKEIQQFLNNIAKVPDQADMSRQVCALIQIAPESPPASSIPRRGRRGKERQA